MKSLFPYKENNGLLKVDYEDYLSFKQSNGDNNIGLKIIGGEDLRRIKIHNIARKFGASKYYESMHLLDAREVEFNLFDADMTTFLEQNNKIMTFTDKACVVHLGEGDSMYRASKSKIIPHSVAEKYGAVTMSGNRITTKGISVESMLDVLVDRAFRMGAEIDANMINVRRIVTYEFKTSLILEFYKR